ncbi:4'-phosphopantetheine phosphatase-like [Ptychodera flava]|uniref:4'-phosphopantetheine phosphatase-like n=1 Tax=Ptychodera flava TaxID=63121 RepID=UPI00396AA1ED
MAQADSSHDSSYARSIELPPDQVFRNLQNAKRFAIDIGGSLAKLAYYTTVQTKRAHFSGVEKDQRASDSPLYEVTEQEETRERLHFVKFETKYIEQCLDFVKQNLIESKDQIEGKVIKATGGGAYKYKDIITSKLGLEVEKEDEMTCLIKGSNFLLRNIPDEAFSYVRHAASSYQFQACEPNIFPYLLVNIGSGVSIVKVESEDKCERIGGTAMGGGTFWGLGSLLTKAKGFDELLKLAVKGDHRNVDMLVRDIYGGAYSALALPEDLLASSFGKTARNSLEKGDEVPYSEEDIAKSLLHMISNGIGQIACLYANLHKIKKVYFGGYFIRGQPVTMNTITFAINYWSKGEVQALFLRHEGYLGAIGAFLKGAEEDDTLKYQWGENYAGSSGLSSPPPYMSFVTRGRSSTFDMLELDKLDRPLVYLPSLVCPTAYHPDVVDLTKDAEAREYWLDCFEEALDRVAECALKSQPNSVDAVERAEQFKDKYRKRLHGLRSQPFAYGSLTVRSLLDTREHCLNEFSFADPYSQVKQQENELALKLLGKRLQQLSAMNWYGRQVALIEGVLAGNVFDYGAKEVTALMDKNAEFGFHDAMAKLQGRPWLIDNLDEWIERLKGAPHELAVIFVDNSGADIVLGIFPFVRELLKRGTNVILSANSKPALNDITHSELMIVTERVAELDPDISLAVTEGRLQLLESGGASPCLDLSRVDHVLAKSCKQADLLIFEGMGRAVHTNLQAQFTCESLKLAVLKNKWLANRLGGEVFSVMCKYEPGSKQSSDPNPPDEV